MEQIIENKDYSKSDNWASSKEHKQSCERFLKFLEMIVNDHRISKGEKGGIPNAIHVKITDLKKAIKLYEENRL